MRERERDTFVSISAKIPLHELKDSLELEDETLSSLYERVQQPKKNLTP